MSRIDHVTGGNPGEKMLLLGSAIILGAAGVFDLLTHAALWMSGGTGSWNPFRLLLQLFQGELSIRWWAWLAVLLPLILVSAVTGWLVWRARRNTVTRRRGDEKARLLGGRAASRAVRERTVAEKAEGFLRQAPEEVKQAAKRSPGFPLGRDVDTGEALFGDYESVAIYVAGPRSGKTAAIAIPVIVSAPGAVVATSNKRDLVDLTRLPREKAGEVFIFDASNILKRDPEIFWNPLSFLRAPSGYEGSIVARAERLSSVFGDAGRAAGGGDNNDYDAFFDTTGDAIRAELLAAAAVKPDGTMTDVFRWVNDQNDEEPIELLSRAGLQAMAEDLRGNMNLPADTKGGAWACAVLGLGFIKDEETRGWYTPGRNPDGTVRREFDPVAFAHSTNTLYSMSRDSSSMTPLVAALTAVVAQAAEYAAEAAGGRLPIPMMIVLDEAANVCPWRELPKLQSHYGSKGLCLHTILQSWSQGKAVWGDLGMNMLWSAANVAMYLGGVKEVEFLDNMSKLIGKHRLDSRSTSYSNGQRTYSTNIASDERPIADVEELAAMEPWRAWLFASKSRPVLVELVPWFTTVFRKRHPGVPDLISESEKVYGAAANVVPNVEEAAPVTPVVDPLLSYTGVSKRSE